MSELRSRLENLELSSAKKAVTLSGYILSPENKKHEEHCRNRKFFGEKLGY